MTTHGDDASIRPDWRSRVKAIGKTAFELEEMLRLGFITTEQIDMDGTKSVAYQAALDQVWAAYQDIEKISERIHDLESVDYHLSQIRTARIERVRAERQERIAMQEAADAQRSAEIAYRRKNEPWFLGPGVSNMLTFTGGDADRLSRSGVPPLTNMSDIAHSIGVSPSRLQWLAYHAISTASDHYVRFTIPKRKGGARSISSPKQSMRKAQTWIRERILEPLPVHPAATAFRPGRSIVSNAEVHLGSHVILKADLRNFFPSIRFPRVRGYFTSLGYNPGVSTVLALLCTDAPRARVELDGQVSYVTIGERSLPQGACTSPDLANLIAAHLDRRLAALAASCSWRYTRYADDLVLSSTSTDSSAHSLLRTVDRIIVDEGFSLNAKKTRIMRRPNRQVVTGLMVGGESVRLSRHDMRKIRAFLHRCEQRGLEDVSRDIGKDARAVARGYFSYVHMIDPGAASRLRERHSWI